MDAKLPAFLHDRRPVATVRPDKKTAPRALGKLPRGLRQRFLSTAMPVERG